MPIILALGRISVFPDLESGFHDRGLQRKTYLALGTHTHNIMTYRGIFHRYFSKTKGNLEATLSKITNAGLFFRS